MVTERDKHIQKIVERAQKERGSTGGPMRVNRKVTSVAPPSPTAAQPKVVPPRRHSAVESSAERSLSKGVSTPKRAPMVAPAKVNSSEPKRYIWSSLLLIFVAGFLFISIISYFKNWQVDASLSYWRELFGTHDQMAMNWGGRLGAVVSHNIIGLWVGLSGILLPFIVALVAVKLLHISGLKLGHSIGSLLVIMFVASIALGHFAGFDASVFGSGLGGASGIYVARWMEKVIGSEGTSLFIVLGSVGVIYFVNAAFLRAAYNKINNFIVQYKANARLRAQAAAEREAQMRQQIQQQAVAQAEAAAAVRTTMPPTTEPIVSPVAEVMTIDEATFAQVNPVEVSQVESASEQTIVAPEMETGAPIEESLSEDCSSWELVTMDDGRLGCLLGYDYASDPVIYYLDSEALKRMPAVAESMEEDDEFVLTTRSVSEPPLVVAATPKSVATVVSKPVVASASVSRSYTPSPDDQNFIVEHTEVEQEVDDRIINLSELYDPTAELSGYRKPPVGLMHDHSRKVTVTDQELLDNKAKIVYTLDTFGIKIDTIEATIGPTVTLYEIIPAPGVRISKIKNLEDDIALALSALGIRIIAPIPGKGTIGIEVPNKEKEVVSMYSVIKSAKFQESTGDLPIALGKTIQNETFVLDLAKMPHLLVAGATGQGKSVGLNAIITSLLYKKHPAELKFILVDPKKVELTLYARLEKHFLAKMEGEDEAIITDTQKVIFTLNSICIEMDTRYDLLKAAKVRNIKEYNEKFVNRRLNPEKGHRFLPYFVVIIDEFADLIMTAGREVEAPIARIAQLARAVGIHLIIATQRPTTNIITGVIKANFPARIAFRVSSQIDSRTILDHTGANQLVGRGDMLVSTGNEITRVQCAFIDTPEVELITEHIGKQKGYFSAYELPEYVPESDAAHTSREDEPTKRDSLFEEVARYVVANQIGSASTIQRKFSIGFVRAGRLVDQLEAAGVVGRADGSKARQVLLQDERSLENIL
ncbi:MAG: DNA translocase FtsK 4TM domain-containing protein [Mucinivorans sp.]